LHHKNMQEPIMETSSSLVATKKPTISAGAKGLTFANLDELWRFCQAVVNSGQFGKEINTPEVALIRLQAGMELGLSPIWSLVNIFVVNGRPTVYGDALLGIVRAHRDFVDIRETLQGEGDNMVAICEIDRRGQSTTARRFSVKDAKCAGLWGKSGPWASYPMRMLQMRARAWACRDAFADALRGLGVSEEIRDIEPKPIQAREIERPKLILPDEEILPVPVLADPKPSEPIGTGEASESNVVGDLMPSEQSGVVEDSDGGQFPLDPKNEKGEFEF
jgi:hypothetical protein